MKEILKMNFPDDTDIDVGSITFDRYKENLHLLCEDISKHLGGRAMTTNQKGERKL